MTDYISREAALKDFESCNAKNPRWTPQRVKTLLLRQNAAGVEPVVQCKKCAQARPTVRCSDGKQTGIWCSYHDIWMRMIFAVTGWQNEED
nr:MAG TPA: hypothetical protein [Caudoviricetes sp.]